MIDYKTKRTENTNEQGLYVAAVSYNKDFLVGDRIVAINGAEVATSGQMRSIINVCQPGDTINVTVLRDSQPVDIGVTLTPADIPPAGATTNAA